LAVHRSSRIVLAAAFVAALGLCACGRKGPLDLPPGDGPAPMVSAAPAPAPGGFSSQSFLPGASSAPAVPPPAVDAQGNPILNGPKRPFILDPILQ
jgi:predicted small lipoprotein YifL